MTTNGIVQILLFFGIIILVTKPLGLFMSRLFQGERTFLHPLRRPLEALTYCSPTPSCAPGIAVAIALVRGFALALWF